MAINYMVGNLGKPYSETAAVIDQGGGSVQMAYAISRENAEKAPTVADGEDPYVEKFLLRGAEYYVYVHRFSSSSLINSLKLLLINIVSVGFSSCSTFCHLCQKKFLAFLKRTRSVVS